MAALGSPVATDHACEAAAALLDEWLEAPPGGPTAPETAPMLGRACAVCILSGDDDEAQAGLDAAARLMFAGCSRELAEYGALAAVEVFQARHTSAYGRCSELQESFSALLADATSVAKSDSVVAAWLPRMRTGMASRVACVAPASEDLSLDLLPVVVTALDSTASSPGEACLAAAVGGLGVLEGYADSEIRVRVAAIGSPDSESAAEAAASAWVRGSLAGFEVLPSPVWHLAVAATATAAVARWQEGAPGEEGTPWRSSATGPSADAAAAGAQAVSAGVAEKGWPDGSRDASGAAAAAGSSPPPLEVALLGAGFGGALPWLAASSPRPAAVTLVDTLQAALDASSGLLVALGASSDAGPPLTLRAATLIGASLWLDERLAPSGGCDGFDVVVVDLCTAGKPWGGASDPDSISRLARRVRPRGVLVVTPGAARHAPGVISACEAALGSDRVARLACGDEVSVLCWPHQQPPPLAGAAIEAAARVALEGAR